MHAHIFGLFCRFMPTFSLQECSHFLHETSELSCSMGAPCWTRRTTTTTRPCRLPLGSQSNSPKLPVKMSCLSMSSKSSKFLRGLFFFLRLNNLRVQDPRDPGSARGNQKGTVNIGKPGLPIEWNHWDHIKVWSKRMPPMALRKWLSVQTQRESVVFPRLLWYSGLEPAYLLLVVWSPVVRCEKGFHLPTRPGSTPNPQTTRQGQSVTTWAKREKTLH